MPDNPSTPALDRLRTDLDQKIETTRIDLRGEIARAAAETRRHFDVVAEHFMSRLELVAEGVTMVDQKVDRLRDEMEQRFDQVERRLLPLS